MVIAQYNKMNLKFSLLLLLITFKQISAQNNQVSVLNQKITIEIHDETIHAILKKIEKQTGKSFSYDSKIIDPKKKQTVSYKKKSLSQVISLLFDDKIQCKLVGNNIVLYRIPVASSHHPQSQGNKAKKIAPMDSRLFLKRSKTRNDTTVRYFIDIIVPDSSGKDSVIRTESIEVPFSHFLQIKDDSTIILLKKDSVPTSK
jgi:hypothetical protein